MVIDMNLSRLEAIEQIREFLNGTEVAFSNPADESTAYPLCAAFQEDRPQGLRSSDGIGSG
jgi:hypothetical protein